MYFHYEEPLFRPPSEAQSLILQATIGCSQNRCRFCGMYKMKEFRLRPVGKLLEEIQSVPGHIGQRIRRVFLADGDALIYPQKGLETILDALMLAFPNLTRVGAYASPNSLTSKTSEQMAVLQLKKLRILYFGLESGDSETLGKAGKGFEPDEMLQLCRKAQKAGIKLSVTAILGLAGRERSLEHATATADWINALSPEYFSLLTMFQRHNDDWFTTIMPLSQGEILEEIVVMMRRLSPARTILRSNHVSNFVSLAGSYPKDRQRLLDDAEAALARGRLNTLWFNEITSYSEAYY